MKHWPTKPLGELVDFVGGGTPRRDRPDYWDGEIPWASVKDLQCQSLETTLETITAKGLANSASNLIPQGTVIIASRVGLGKVAINLKPVAINQDLKALTPRSSDLSPRYLLLFLLSKAEYFERTGVGATVKGLTLADYQRLDIVLPPLAEQERIVKLLDEADELRKLRAQADRRTVDLIPSFFQEMIGGSAASRNGLPMVPLGSLLSFRTGKLDSNAAVKDGAYPFFTCSREDSRIDTFAFDCEALLLAENNATGDYSVKHYKGKFNAYQRTYVLNLLNVDHSYAFMQQAIQLKLQDLKRLSLGTNTKYLTLGILKNIQIALPAPEQQKEFAARVEEIRALQAEQSAGRSRLDDLFQSLLHRAFQGEL